MGLPAGSCGAIALGGEPTGPEATYPPFPPHAVLPQKTQTRGQWERRRQDTGGGRVGAGGELVPGPSRRCGNTAAGRRSRPGLRTRVSATPSAPRTPKANDSRIPPGASGGAGGLAGGGGESGTCAPGLRGLVREGGNPLPRVSPAARLWGPEGQSSGGKGPSRRRGGAGTPPPATRSPSPPAAGRGWLASGAEVTFSTAPAASGRFPGFSRRRRLEAPAGSQALAGLLRPWSGGCEARTGRRAPLGTLCG